MPFYKGYGIINKQIQELFKTSKPTIKRAFSTFASDAYGTWSNNISQNAGGYGVINHTQLFSRCHYLGNGAYFWGLASSGRTIHNLKKAREINFTYSWSRVGNNVWVWNSFNGYFRLLNQFVTLNTTALYVGGATIMGLGEGATYNITLKQQYVVVNGTRYNYPSGIQLKNAAGDYCDAYCQVGQVTAGGYACIGDLYITVGDIKVKW